MTFKIPKIQINRFLTGKMKDKAREGCSKRKLLYNFLSPERFHESPNITRMVDDRAPMLI